MNRRIVHLHRRFRAAIPDELLGHLMRVETGIVDGVMINGRATVGHPVGNELTHAGTVLDPDGDCIP